MPLEWGIKRNIENSLYVFLTDKIDENNVTDSNNDKILIRVGRKVSKDWTLPCITIYLDDTTSERAEVGSNNRLKSYLIIMDIYATNDGERLDLSDWLEKIVENGFRYFSMLPSTSGPQTPIQTAGGLVEVNFVTNARVALGQNVDPEDAHRHRISINTWISGN